MQLFPSPKSGGTQGRAGGQGSGGGPGTPSPQPVIPAAPSETLKRHNANSLALWPPRRCHGAVAENKHNSPHVFSASSTPRPSAPEAALAPSGSAPAVPVPHPARSGASQVEQGFPGEGRHGPGSGWTRDGGEMEVWAGMARGKGEDVPGIAAPAQPGRWHRALPARRARPEEPAATPRRMRRACSEGNAVPARPRVLCDLLPQFPHALSGLLSQDIPAPSPCAPAGSPHARPHLWDGFAPMVLSPGLCRADSRSCSPQALTPGWLQRETGQKGQQGQGSHRAGGENPPVTPGCC